MHSIWKGHWEKAKRPNSHFSKKAFWKIAFLGPKKSKLRKIFLTKVVAYEVF